MWKYSCPRYRSIMRPHDRKYQSKSKYNMWVFIKWGASCRWSSSLYCTMHNWDQIAMGKTHLALLKRMKITKQNILGVKITQNSLYMGLGIALVYVLGIISVIIFLLVRKRCKNRKAQAWFSFHHRSFVQLQLGWASLEPFCRFVLVWTGLEQFVLQLG